MGAALDVVGRPEPLGRCTDRPAGLVAWCGLVVVAQNIAASLFNSHLFDFNQGWLYVFAVGALGGTVLSVSARKPAATG